MLMHFVRSVLKIQPHRRPHGSYFLDTFDSTVKFPVGAIWRRTNQTSFVIFVTSMEPWPPGAMHAVIC